MQTLFCFFLCSFFRCCYFIFDVANEIENFHTNYSPNIFNTGKLRLFRIFCSLFFLLLLLFVFQEFCASERECPVSVAAIRCVKKDSMLYTRYV